MIKPEIENAFSVLGSYTARTVATFPHYCTTIMNEPLQKKSLTGTLLYNQQQKTEELFACSTSGMFSAQFISGSFITSSHFVSPINSFHIHIENNFLEHLSLE